MENTQACDICGRAATDIPRPEENTTPQVSVDADGLWICHLCQGQMKSVPIGISDNPELDDDLKPLVGKSAGAICRTLELPFRHPYQNLIEAASKIAYDKDRYMSAWLFADQWLDGTTLWRSADGKHTARVSPTGKIDIDAQ